MKNNLFSIAIIEYKTRSTIYNSRRGEKKGRGGGISIRPHTREDVNYILYVSISANTNITLRAKHNSLSKSEGRAKVGRGWRNTRRFSSSRYRLFHVSSRGGEKNGANGQYFFNTQTSRDTNLAKNPDDYTATPRPWTKSILFFSLIYTGWSA